MTKILAYLALLAITLIGLGALAGCSEMPSPLGIEDTTTVGELKSSKNDIAVTKGIEIIETFNAPAAAPSIVREIGADGILEISFEHKDTTSEGDEVFTIVAVEGFFVGNDELRFYINKEYVGKVDVEEGKTFAGFDVKIKGSEFPKEAGVAVKIKVARDSRIAAHATVTLDRSPKGIQFKQVLPGEEKDEIILVFSEAVDAYRQLRDNIEVVDEDGEGQSIWSYGEDGERLTLIMRDDLDPGKYTVVYNGEGGLEGRDGSDVAAFEGEFVVEDKDPVVITPEIPETPENPNDPALFWKEVPHGIFGSGQEIVDTLTVLNYAVSPWTQFLFRLLETETARGNTVLCLVDTEVLVPVGPLTAERLRAAVKDSDRYEVVPDETAGVLRLMYLKQPKGESLLVLSKEIRGCAFFLGGGNDIEPRQNINAIVDNTELSRDEFKKVVVALKK